jgi:uncharacterized protein (UPF0276 family)
MTSAPGSPTAAPRPSIGFSYSGRDPALLARVLPHIDVVEINPDDLTVPAGAGDAVRLDPAALAHLAEVAADVTVVAHGVTLSIGTAEGMSAAYLRLLDELFAAVDVAWHSEHLGYTRAAGLLLGNFLDPPRSGEALDLIAGRAAQIVARYGRPFLLENVARLLPDPGGDHTFAGFLDAVAAASGCGVLADVHNLQCDEANVGLDIDGALAALDPRNVGEIHVSAGRWEGRYRMDVHTGLADDTTVALAAVLHARAPHATVTFEIIPQAVAAVGADAIVDQLRALRAALVPAPLPAGVAAGVAG